MWGRRGARPARGALLAPLMVATQMLGLPAPAAVAIEYAPSSSPPVEWADERIVTTIELTVTPAAGAPYDTFTFLANVSPNVPGTRIGGVVRFYRGDGPGMEFAEVAVNPNGVARAQGLFTVANPQVVHAEYSGDANFAASRSDNETFGVERISLAMNLELDRTVIEAGDSVVATVTIDPPPSVFPPNPTAGLTFVSRAGVSHFEAVPIDPTTGIGQVTITSDELTPEVWTARASFAQAPPDNARYVPATTSDVQLRYEPVGPSHAITFAPAQLYEGDTLTIGVALNPAPTGGTIELYGTTGVVGSVPVLIGSQPAASTVQFDATRAQGVRYFSVFSGTTTDPPSRSDEAQPTVLLYPNSMIAAPGPWTHSAAMTLSFGVFPGAVAPVTFDCSIDGGAWFGCSAPYTAPPLTDGHHTFGVRARDGNGRVEPAAEQVAWRIDTSAPVITTLEITEPIPAFEAPISLAVAATDQTLGLHGGSMKVLVSSSPQVNSFGWLQHAAEWPLGAAELALDFDFTASAWGGSPSPGPKTVYVQILDPFGWETPVQELDFRPRSLLAPVH